ncbi:MAG: oligopeptidase B [Bacteroidetes bacterium HGW-Bacteroidetes-4]|jgi:oligopeptidase B|nr:MAG: oligopeptidase B [Bacteroidetes bacterium HGW-Bacteroidetes-4]
MVPKVIKTELLSPPVAARHDKICVHHGHQRIDPYYWMRLSDAQKHAEIPDQQTKEVLQYLTDENTYCKQVLKPVRPLQKKIYKELVERIQLDYETAPYFNNNYWYYTRYAEGCNYPVYCRKYKTLESDEQLMLDANQRARENSFYHVTGLMVSPDNTLLAFGEDTLGRRIYTIRFLNLKTGQLLPDKIKNTTGTGAWANDNRTFFYTTKNKMSLLSNKIWRHKLGTEKKDEDLVLHEKDPSFYIGVFRSKSGKYIFIHEQSTLSSNFYFLNADTPDANFVQLTPRIENHKYFIEHYKDKFYIRTSLEAENFRLMETSIKNHHVENWVEVLPHNPDVLMQSIEIFENFLVVEERFDALPQIRIIHQTTNKQHLIKFHEEAYVVKLDSNLDFYTHTLRFKYASMTTPETTIDYNMESRQHNYKKIIRVPGHIPDNYITRRLYARARDGELIPLSLVYKKDLVKDGSAPCVLYAYGAYAETVDAYFDANHLSLINRGFIWAIAHVRGGQAKGRYWYQAGKLLQKKNTFYDFMDCAQFLIDEKYSSPGHMYAMGESAGGLLMGVIANIAGYLFKGIIAEVPFVDVVTTMLDESIPLTTNEFDEWGNPKIQKFYKYLYSYSPYDQVKVQDYPNMLVTTGFFDSQVQFWEPAKWVAKLRQSKTDNNLLLLYTNMEAGHFGASGRYQRFSELSLYYSFLIMLEGIKT